jgi:hypothetical protein
MIAFTLIITAFLPEMWLHPFGPVRKTCRWRLPRW